jgi:hypothetical protein
MRKRAWRAAALPALALLAASACATRTVEVRGVPPSQADPGIATSLVIEQFLRAVNANDLDTMARLFGTRDGSVLRRDPKRSVDDRMFALASVLRHQDYTISGNTIVPGRREEATQVNVRMAIGGRDVLVPYTLVLSRQGTWLIEQIGIEQITARR